MYKQGQSSKQLSLPCGCCETINVELNSMSCLSTQISVRVSIITVILAARYKFKVTHLKQKSCSLNGWAIIIQSP